jgi:hypothetical protein
MHSRPCRHTRTPHTVLIVFHSVADPDPLLSKYGWLKKSVGWSELLYFALFLLCLASILVMIVYARASTRIAPLCGRHDNRVC